MEEGVRKAVKLAPILLDEMEESVYYLVSMIYDLSEEQPVLPDGLSGADPKNKESIKELSLEDAYTQDRDKDIKGELIEELSEPESIELTK